MPARNPAITIRKIRGPKTAELPADPGEQLPPDPGEDRQMDDQPQPGGETSLPLDTQADFELAEDLRLQEIMASEQNAGAKFEVLHKGRDGEWNFCTYFLMEEWGPAAKQKIAHQFGGGQYKVRVRRRDNRWGTSFDFSLDPSLKPSAPESNLPVPARPDGGGGMTELLITMLQSSRQEAAEARRDAVAAQQESTKLIMGVMTAVLGRPQPSVSDELIKTLAEKAFKPSGQPSELTVLIGALVQLKKVMDSGAIEGGQKKDVFESLFEHLPDILALLNKGIDAATVPVGGSPADRARPVGPGIKAAQPLAVAAADAPVIAMTAPAAAPLPPDQEAAQFKQALAPALPQLCTSADQQLDPAAVADSIAENLDDDKLLALQKFLKRPDWLAVMIDAHEPVQMRSPWFNRLRDEILAIAIEPEPAPAAETVAVTVLPPVTPTTPASP